MASTVKSKNEHLEDKCKIYVIHVHVHDVQNKIREVFDVLRNTSWIEKLQNPTAKLSYTVAVERTIKKLTEEIFNGGVGSLTEKTGEYVISVSASQILNKECGHTVVPISELWKEQISGNPGFDFHSLNPDSILIFGEAKYKSNPPSPHGTAFDQIIELITEKKDVMDLVHLEQFVGVFPIQKYTAGHKGYAAAFSLNAVDCDSVIANVYKSEKAVSLKNYSELYLIGVEFVS